MIESVSGRIKFVRENIVVDVKGIGIGLQVACPKNFEIDQDVFLYVYVHWNSEKGPSFFGFSSELEKNVFLLVISCSGIGPKIGLSVLRDLGAKKFLEAISMEDERALSSVSGLGEKKIEQMIVQLRRKVKTLLDSDLTLQDSNGFYDWQKISDVLISLNYSRVEISRAMKFLKAEYADSEVQFDALVRGALSFLAKNR